MQRGLVLTVLWVTSLLAITACSPPSSVPGAYPPTGMVNSQPTLVKRLTKEGTQVVQLGDTLTLIIPTDKCFDPDTANIQQCCYPMFNDITALLKQYGNVPIKIAAYTDTVASPCHNCEFSQHLADSVVAYLWTHGIPYQQMHAIGYGENNPIASIYTARGSGFNRRIEISLRRDEYARYY